MKSFWLTLFLFSCQFIIAIHSFRANGMIWRGRILRDKTIELPKSVLKSTYSDKFNTKDLLLSDCKSLTRGEINEFVLQLEKQNPTTDPAYSPLLNGVWEVLSGGIMSPGMIGFQAIKAFPGDFIDATDITITISSVAPRVTAETSVKIGFSKLPVSITTNIMAKTGARLTETYESGKIGKLEVPLTNINILTRELLITYLDYDLMIARDSLGTPEILKRKDYSSVRPDSDSSTQTEIPSA